MNRSQIPTLVELISTSEGAMLYMYIHINVCMCVSVCVKYIYIIDP